MKKILPILIALITILTSCQHKALPEGILDAETMSKLLTEVYLLEGYYMLESNNKPEEMTNQIIVSYDTLLAQYNLNAELFEKNLNYYSEHTDLYDTINNRINQNIKLANDSIKALNATKKQIDTLSTTTDSLTSPTDTLP